MNFALIETCSMRMRSNRGAATPQTWIEISMVSNNQLSIHFTRDTAQFVSASPLASSAFPASGSE